MGDRECEYDRIICLCASYSNGIPAAAVVTACDDEDGKLSAEDVTSPRDRISFIRSSGDVAELSMTSVLESFLTAL